MKTVILCGGKGSRLSEETSIRPKPMVEIGGHPILWHIMNCYCKYGITDFILALGYKGHHIKEFFYRYFTNNSDFTIDLKNGQVEHHNNPEKKWKVTLVDTGADTLTGGRLLRLKNHLKDEENFMLTYGDGVADININELMQFHTAHKKIATVSAVRPPARFGEILIQNNQVVNFAEKPQIDVGWINGGFFVFTPKVFDYLENDFSILERSPLENLAKDGELMSFSHKGFWMCMDTLRDKEYLCDLWNKGDAPWARQ